jgi:hypothetical protein
MVSPGTWPKGWCRILEFLIRIMVFRYNGASKEERVEKGKNGHEFAGVGGTKESVEWLWGTCPPFCNS